MAPQHDRSVTQQLLDSRIIYLSGDITTATAESVVSRLLVLDSLDPDAEIKLYISSFGGSVYAGLAIYEAMQLIEAPVATFCLGAAFSMAAWLLAAGTPGRRFATPHARVMLHQVSAGVLGTSSDIKVAAENVLRTEELTLGLLARHTGRAADELRGLTQRDCWLTPEQARELGIIDAVTEPCEHKRLA